MRPIKRIISIIIAAPLVILLLLFVIVAVTQGIDEALELTWSAPRNLFCSIAPFCDVDDETEVVDLGELWTRIHERALLDIGKYETRQSWRAEQTTWPVTHSMRMRATVHVTMGINLDNLTEEQIAIDEQNQTITITMPQVQPVECFLEDIEYYDESCLLVCDDLKQELQVVARRNVMGSDELAAELINARQRAEVEVSNLIEPFIEDYTLQFVTNPEAPPPIESGSCN